MDRPIVLILLPKLHKYCQIPIESKGKIISIQLLVNFEETSMSMRPIRLLVAKNKHKLQQLSK